MPRLLATAHRWTGGGGDLSVLPVLGAAVSLIALVWALRTRPSPPIAAGAVVLGVSFALAADAWGATATIALWSLCAVTVRWVRRGSFGGNGSPD